MFGKLIPGQLELIHAGFECPLVLASGFLKLALGGFIGPFVLPVLMSQHK